MLGSVLTGPLTGMLRAGHDSGQDGSTIEPRNQRRRVPTPAAHCLNLGVELIDQRAHRKVCAIASRLGEADREILAHPIDGESEIELALVHGLVPVLHLPRLRSTFGNSLDQRFDVEAGLLREVDAFGEALHQACDADLVDHLGKLA